MSARANSEPLLLASELSLPMPVYISSTKADHLIASPKGGSPVATSRAFQHLQQTSSSPWQALPVQGPLVSHDVTPGLPVLEPGDASQQARASPTGAAHQGLLTAVKHGRRADSLCTVSKVGMRDNTGAGRAHSQCDQRVQGPPRRADQTPHGVSQARAAEVPIMLYQAPGQPQMLSVVPVVLAP
jgi:hypothetical protein